MARISAILLGAGASRRMGRNKLALPWGGKTVLRHCLDTLLRATPDEIVVVLSDRTLDLRPSLQGRRVKVVFNPDYRKGMSTSIRRGVQAADSRSEGILIALGDQPFLSPRTIDALIFAFRQQKGKIIAPCYHGRRGHPVLFHRKFRRELLALRRDAGGRSLLERHSGDLFVFRTRSKGVLKDLDTWRDYRGEIRKRGGAG